jgi:hypothetical protein
MRVPHDPDMIQAFEEDQRAELRGLFFGGFGQSLPELARRASIEINACVLKDSPDESGTVVAAIIGSPRAVGQTEAIGDRVVQRRFDLVAVNRAVFEEIGGRNPRRIRSDRFNTSQTSYQQGARE